MFKAEVRKAFLQGQWRNIIFLKAQGQVLVIKYYSSDKRVQWSDNPSEAEWFKDEGQAFLIAETIFQDSDVTHQFFTNQLIN